MPVAPAVPAAPVALVLALLAVPRALLAALAAAEVQARRPLEQRADGFLLKLQGFKELFEDLCL